MIYKSEYIYQKINDGSKIQSEEEFLNFIKSKNNPDEILLPAFSDLRQNLGQHFKLDRINFLTGNGSSIYAGSKSTLNFHIENAINKKKLEELSDIIKKLSGMSLEEELNALLTIKEFYRITGDEKEANVSEIIASLKDYLLNSYVNSINYENLEYHEILLLKLRSFGCLNRVHFYTLNYDLAFEYILDKLTIPYDNGFSGFVNRRFDPRTLQTTNKTQLIKLHGSVNWIYDQDDRVIKETQPKFVNGKVVVEDAAHVLIYPTEQKLYQTYNAPYSELMRNMLDNFESGRNLIIVLGYKYGDEHINEILIKAVSNPNNVFYFFDYDDGNSEFIKRMMELSKSSPNINIFIGKFLGDFANFVRYMIPANAEKTDEEKIFELLGKVMNHD